jgi:hypothetical protein
MCFLADTVAELRNDPKWHYLKKLHVPFDGQDALDLGWTSREFLYCLSEILTSPIAIGSQILGKQSQDSRVLHIYITKHFSCRKSIDFVRFSKN